VHRTAARGLFRADRRDVVLGMTRRHARAASRAAIQVGRHSPSVWHIFKLKREKLKVKTRKTERCLFGFNF
jgi:hypothetical protein